MESLRASLSCTEVWFTLRALLRSGCSFLNSDIDLKVGNILFLATICFLMCASTSSTYHGRERYTQVWRKHDCARDLSKLRGVTPQRRQQSKMIKSKSKLIFNFWVQTDLTCQYPITYSTLHSPKILVHPWFIRNPICMFTSPLSSVADAHLGPAITIPISLHTLADIHTTDLYFPIKLLFPFLIRVFSEVPLWLGLCSLPL